jgi:CDGSH-type Zn-finger protein
MPANQPGESPAAVIVACADGPLLVRGEFTLRTQAGEEIDTRRRTVALCRCGKSAIRPFCDGTHKAIGFRAPSGRETQ